MTFLEVTLALVMAAVLVAALGGVVGQSLRAWTATTERNELAREARFAMQRVVGAVRATRLLVLPLSENPATTHSEAVRDVLAVALDPELDLDGDGVADADNDRDGRVDEDVGRDSNADGAPGVLGIDDDNDGQVDEWDVEDDDEDGEGNGNKDEEPLNGIDDDGDGAIDEDLDADMNQDGEPGLAGIDDDDDGQVDESDAEDDDEDEDETGNKDEDWIDTVVFFRQGGLLMERSPNPHATSGLDTVERPIAGNVTRFRVERLPKTANDRAELVDIELALGVASGESVSLHTRVRVGATP
jgi:hypothetical protein